MWHVAVWINELVRSGKLLAKFLCQGGAITTGRLRRNVSGVLVSTVDTTEKLYDSTRPWQERVMAGELHSGTLVVDPRSEDRTHL